MNMKKLVSVALGAAALAAPAIASARGNDHQAKGPRMVEYVFSGVVAADSSDIAVDLINVRGLSRNARQALGGATSVTIKLDTNTRYVTRGHHAMQIVLPPPPVIDPVVTPPALVPVPPVVASKLAVGHRVRIIIRAPRGLAAADLPAASVVFDRGPAAARAKTRTAVTPAVQS
jgi:hypothetical protein